MKPSSILKMAASITKSANAQTYYTIRFLVDRDRLKNAYCSYAYFRWVDDTLDSQVGTDSERKAFLQRQQSLLERCYQGRDLSDTNAEESMLVDLIHGDREKDSGLQKYLRGLMQVMAFDVGRRDRLISQIELEDYTRALAGAVTEAMHYHIGHDCFSPRDDTRYLAVSAAHIVHMLRDTFDDVNTGYFNIPREILEAKHITPKDVHSDAYRFWVRDRVRLARAYFKAGRDYLSRVQNGRCRMAGYAYTLHFESLLDAIEREEYTLHPAYQERKTPVAGLRMFWYSFSPLIDFRSHKTANLPGSVQMLRKL